MADVVAGGEVARGCARAPGLIMIMLVVVMVVVVVVI